MAIEHIFTFSPLAVYNFFMRERNQWSDLERCFNYPWPCYTNNRTFGQEYWYSLPEIKIYNESSALSMGEHVYPGPGGSLLNLLLYCTEVNHLVVTYWIKLGTENEYNKEDTNK